MKVRNEIKDTLFVIHASRGDNYALETFFLITLQELCGLTMKDTKMNKVTL